VHPALETQSLVRNFGGFVATNNVSFKLAHGARHALIGPNGAGKTTFINLLTGVLRPTKGVIRLDGRDITTMRRDLRVRNGLVRTFQINQLFGQMTPLETIGAAISERHGRGWDFLRHAGSRSDIDDEIAGLANHFGLADVLDQRCIDLPYGKQRLLEIALAIASGPRVLLLDEPAAGVPEADRHEILSRIAALPPDIAILLIEHDMDLVFNFAQRISVLVAGALLVEGTVDEIARDPKVREVYLGQEAHV
jgi:branched-chain amino acid transport system ATP-binding protein